jgi:hypothetical protein
MKRKLRHCFKATPASGTDGNLLQMHRVSAEDPELLRIQACSLCCSDKFASVYPLNKACGSLCSRGLDLVMHRLG